MDLLRFFCLRLLCLCVRLFICALWSPAGKGLTSWLSCVMSYCKVVTFSLVSWVRHGTCLYRFLIFSPSFTLFALCFRARVFIDALWSPAGNGLTSWLSFVMSNCEVATFPWVSLVRCGA